MMFWIFISTVSMFGTVSLFLLKYRQYKNEHPDSFKPPNSGGASIQMVHEDPLLYYKATAVWACVVLGLVFLYVVPYWNHNPFLWEATPAMLVGFLVATWVGLSTFVVRVNEYGALTLFGAPTKTLDPGFHIAPFGMFQRFVIPGDIIEEHFPGKPDEIFYGDDEKLVPAGQVRAWRFVTGAPTEGTKTGEDNASRSNLLDIQMVVSIGGFVTWRVIRSRVFQFVIAASSDPDQVRTQILGVAYPLIGAEVSKNTVQHVNTHLENLSEELKKRLSDELGRYGIEIGLTRINPPNISHKLSSEIRDAAQARAKAVGILTLATADKNKRRLEGEGDGLAEEARIKGRGAGVKLAAKEIGVDPIKIFAGQVAENSIGKGDLVVLGSESLQNVLGGGLGSLALRGLRKKEETKEE